MKRVIFLAVLTAIFISQTSFSLKVNSFSDEDNRKKIAQTLLDDLINERYEDVTKAFHASLKTALPVEKISEVWKQVISINGPFEKVLSVNTGTDKGFDQIKMRCHFEKENATVETTFNEDDKIVGLFIKP
jgi:hypothetical protein